MTHIYACPAFDVCRDLVPVFVSYHIVVCAMTHSNIWDMTHTYACPAFNVCLDLSSTSCKDILICIFLYIHMYTYTHTYIHMHTCVYMKIHLHNTHTYRRAVECAGQLVNELQRYSYSRDNARH